MNAIAAPVAASPITAPITTQDRPLNHSNVTLWDVSTPRGVSHPRYGCKGPAAAAWLEGLGLPVPAAPNRWLALPRQGLIARLGNSEFLIEDPDWSKRLVTETPPAQVAFVLRQDALLVLGGKGATELLRQVCNVDFAAARLGDAPVFLTSMAGVSVIVIPREADPEETSVARGSLEGLYYHIWCDGTFGDYLWETLHEVAEGAAT
jgi:sarcosine oxidase subunit gamma